MVDFAKFRYKQRSVETVAARANPTLDYDSYVKSEFSLYKTKADNWIRILPPTWEDAEHYGYDVYVHFNVGPNNGSIICPSKTEKKRCPICEDQQKADRRGDDDEASKLKANRRVLVWLLDRLDPEAGPLLWAMPWTLDRDIAKISVDRRDGTYYCIDDPENGYDLTIIKEGTGMKTKYTPQINRKPSSIQEKMLQQVIENPLPTVLLHRTYEEIVTLYRGEEATAEAPAKEEPKPATREEPKPTTRSRTREEMVDRDPRPEPTTPPWTDEPVSREEAAHVPHLKEAPISDTAASAKSKAEQLRERLSRNK